MRSSVTVSRSSSRRSASPRTPGSSANSPKASAAPQSEGAFERRDPVVAGQRAPARSSKRDGVELDAGRRRWRTRRRRRGRAGRARAHRRRRETWLCSVARADSGGSSSHSASPRRSTLTSAPRAATSTARSCRRFNPSIGTSAPSRRTSSGPSTLTATPDTTAPLSPRSTPARLRRDGHAATSRTAGGRQVAHRHDRAQRPPNQGGTTMPFVNVKLIKGVFDADQKREMIEKLTDTMVEIEGEAMRPVTWVTIEEVESGDWGIGGKAAHHPGRARPPVRRSRLRRSSREPGADGDGRQRCRSPSPSPVPRSEHPPRPSRRPTRPRRKDPPMTMDLTTDLAGPPSRRARRRTSSVPIR